MKKYFLHEIVLSNEVATSKLEQQPAPEYAFLSNPVVSLDELYDERADYIKCVIDNTIKQLDSLTGSEALDVICQRESILKALDSKKSFILDTIAMEQYSFVDGLEYAFDVALNHINNYRKASESLKGERAVNVILDGNNTELVVNGETQRFGASVIDNQVTMETCEKAMKRLSEFGCLPTVLTFLLSVYTHSEGNECDDFPEECLLNREAKYYSDTKTLLIYENGELVHEEQQS